MEKIDFSNNIIEIHKIIREELFFVGIIEVDVKFLI